MFEYVSLGNGPFVGCPGDVDEYAVELDRLFGDLVIPGGPSALYHWKKSYDPGARGSSEPDQYLIARTRDATVSPVFVLFGNLLGSAVPPPSEGWTSLRAWLDANGWGERIALLGEPDFPDRESVPAGKIPLSGTMFELFDVLSSPDDTELRVFDLSQIAGVPEGVPADVLKKQQTWLRAFLEEYGKRKHLVRPSSKEAFRTIARKEMRQAFGIGFLDPLKDDLPGLDAVSNGALLFGREGDVARLTRRVFDLPEARSTIVLGRSGVGKSSLLRAGLMRDWYVRGSLRGSFAKATSVVVEPELLSPFDRPDVDPLQTLGEVLCDTGQDAEQRAIVQRALPGQAPKLAVATGDLETDLSAALDWWEALSARAEGPIVVLLDQAEQIDAMTRRLARDRADDRDEESPQDVALSPAWMRFTGLLAALTGRFGDLPLSEVLRERVKTFGQEAQAHVVLGLHRRSALDLWPLARDADRSPDEVLIAPLCTEADWDKVLRGTFAAYDLRLEDGLLRDMKAEAVRLADMAVRVADRDAAPEDDTSVERSSVLPQVVTAMQRMMTAWRDAMSERDGATLQPADMVLTAEQFGKVAGIEGAIDALGEEALHHWAGHLAEATGARVEGHFSRQQFEAQVLQGFSGLMTRLVDAGAGGHQDLSLVARAGRVAEDHAGLIGALRVRRLLTHVDGTYLRLSHRSVLDHWERAGQWLQGSEARFKVKAKARRFLEMGADFPPETWPEAVVNEFAALLLDWVGGGAGQDAALRDQLREAIVARFDVASLAYPGDTLMQRLPIAALLQDERHLFERLYAQCLASEHLPEKADMLCLLFAEAGSAKALDQLLTALGPEAAKRVANHVQDATGIFPLFSACQQGHEDCVAALIEAGADVNMVDPIDGGFPLLMASQQGHEGCVAALIDAGADVNRVNKKTGTFPLLQASQNGHAGCVAALIEARADVNAVNKKTGTFPLLMASQNGHAGCVTALIEARADVNRVNKKTGTFPLLMASQEGHEGCVAALIEARADVNAVNKKTGTFPLFSASQNGHEGCVAALIEARADVDMVDPIDGGFPLLMASQNGHAGCVAALIDAGADVNRVNKKTGTFPLLQASQNGHAGCVAALIEARADVNAVNKKTGTFPLLMASQNGHAGCVTALIEARADVNRVNKKTGTFPLLMASQNGHESCVAALIEARADVTAVNETNGTFPLLMASQEGHEGCIAALIEARADVNMVDPIDGGFPLLMASANGHLACVEQLLDAGADIDKAHVENGATALVVAFVRGHRDVVELLLVRGASRENLPDELNEALDALLSGEAFPTEDDAEEESAPSDGDQILPPPPLPGDWETQDIDEAFAQRLSSALRDAGINPTQFKGVIAAERVNRYAELKCALHRTAFALQTGDQTLAVDLFWIDPEDFPPAPLPPGTDLSGILVDLLPDRGLRMMNADPLKAIAQLVLLLNAEPAYPLQDEDGFASQNAEPLKHGSYPDTAWRGAQVSHAPDRITVDLSAVSGPALNRYRVTFQLAPLRVLPPQIVHKIADGVAPQSLPFYQAEDGYLPIRILGAAGEANDRS